MYKMTTKADVIAQLVDRKALGGPLREAIVRPTEAAVVIRNGKVEDIVGSTKLQGLRGTLASWALSKLGGGEDLQILFVDTSPFDLEFPIGKSDGTEATVTAPSVEATSRDYLPLKGVCTLRLQVAPDEAPKLLELMRRVGKEDDKGVTDLATIDVANHIQREFLAQVLQPAVARFDASEIRGNFNVVEQIENSVMSDMRKTLANWGIHPVRVFSVWQENAFDRLMRFKREEAIARETEDVRAEQTLSALRRDHNKSMLEIEQKWLASFAEAEAQERIETIRVQGRLQRELEQRAKIWDEDLRQFRTRGDAEIADLRGRMQVEAEKERLEMEGVMGAFREVQKAKQERMRLEQEHQVKQMEMQTDIQKALLEAMKGQGQVDAAIALELLKQQTLQKMADRETEKVAAMAEAEKARAHLETYQSAEDRERAHQVAMAEQAAKLMAAAKPEVPQTLVQGTPTTAGVSVQAPQVARRAPSTGICPKCGAPVKPLWKLCPECEANLQGPFS